ncbi:nuclease-related domain-containing protein [Ureibacillus manganicus]|uniref:NERD domain-containing protein n=1 Tax=Ureibacillus manganicus DSM 26584 TaxID=1384049 RepID=A0A0A3I6C0_9BACL|nr:nuclease-related domain-containing protein [Ureibacillus manganicus]KGR80264.1 hypothetical protein CD29_02600 [Ureibacillus manganicus DSM 26584]
MSEKKRTESAKLQALEAIVRRFPKDDIQYDKYKTQLAWAKSGLFGEQRVDKEYLDMNIQIPHVYLYGLMTENEAGFQHEIDSIFICQHFVLVIEIKNYSGFIEFDEKTHQCIKKNFDGDIVGFSNPVDQVRRHRNFVTYKIREKGIDMPIESALIFANPKSILGKLPFNDVLVFHVVGLRYKIHQLIEKHTDERITVEQMMSIGQLVKSMHNNKPWEFNIDREKLQKGVLCSECNYCVVMNYHHGGWKCPRCDNRAHKEVLEALDDYRLLWGDRISNREFREFIGLASQKTAYRILKILNFKSEGASKNKKYIIPRDIRERIDLK